MRQLTSNTPRNNNKNGKYRQATKVADDECDPDGYCWSHGFRVKRGHDSKTCYLRKNGHQEDATRTDNKGGVQYNKDWKYNN